MSKCDWYPECRCGGDCPVIAEEKGNRWPLVAVCVVTVFVIIALFGLLIWTAMARAHEAPLGWTYPDKCCSNQDCREVADADVREGPGGYVIRATGEVVPYGDPRVKDSPDGRFHWCALDDGLSGPREMSTICLFAPPRDY